MLSIDSGISRILCAAIALAIIASSCHAVSAMEKYDGILLAKKKEKRTKQKPKNTESLLSEQNPGDVDASTTSKGQTKSEPEKKSDDSEKQELLEGQRTLRSFSGNASWYGIPFHGRKTASGEIFDMNKLSAAHLTLPLPTRCIVEDPRTGNAVIVKVNDRGPYVKTRVMDLSREAARELGTLSRGVAFIDVTVLEDKRNKSKKS